MADPAGQEAEASLLSEAAAATAPELASDLQRLALERGITVGTAESCTGGLVGHSITAHAGSSGYYRGGIVSYADDVKVDPLGVPATTLEHHGAVSAQVAVAMAEGVRGLVGCDYGVAVTGVAGPAGGSDAKPVGLTYVAVAGPDGHEVRRHLWDGDRSQNKEHSAAAALTLLRDVIASTAGPA
jgi:PncC family amidohydrolase